MDKRADQRQGERDLAQVGEDLQEMACVEMDGRTGIQEVCDGRADKEFGLESGWIGMLSRRS